MQQKIANAAFERWTMGSHFLGVLPAGWLTRTLRRARMSRWLPIVAAGAVAALVALAFVIGIQLGQPATAQQAAPPAATSTMPTAAPPEGTAGNTPAPLTGTINFAPAANQQYFAFVKVGASYYPQSLCTTNDSATWVCTQQYTPPPKSGTPPRLVAISMSPAQQSEMYRQAEANKANDGKPNGLKAIDRQDYPDWSPDVETTDR